MAETDETQKIKIVLTEGPGPESCFVEVEDEHGSLNIGEWYEREDGLWELHLAVDWNTYIDAAVRRANGGDE